MVLYSIIPAEAVMREPFPGEAPEARPRMVTVDCGLLELAGEGDRTQVRRLISTDLRAYLNPAYSPGAFYRAPAPDSAPEPR